ncbi:MAG: hypothetical protein ACI83P_002483 [Janthinobacterium sp.]|jgi:hypothetical protein
MADSGIHPIAIIDHDARFVGSRFPAQTQADPVGPMRSGACYCDSTAYITL